MTISEVLARINFFLVLCQKITVFMIQNLEEFSSMYEVRCFAKQFVRCKIPVLG